MCTDWTLTCRRWPFAQVERCAAEAQEAAEQVAALQQALATEQAALDAERAAHESAERELARLKVYVEAFSHSSLAVNLFLANTPSICDGYIFSQGKMCIFASSQPACSTRHDLGVWNCLVSMEILGANALHGLMTDTLLLEQAVLEAQQAHAGVGATAGSTATATPPLPSHGKPPTGSLALDFSRLRSPTAANTPSPLKVCPPRTSAHCRLNSNGQGQPRTGLSCMTAQLQHDMASC
jgi:hypothetical protein